MKLVYLKGYWCKKNTLTIIVKTIFCFCNYKNNSPAVIVHCRKLIKKFKLVAYFNNVYWFWFQEVKRCVSEQQQPIHLHSNEVYLLEMIIVSKFACVCTLRDWVGESSWLLRHFLIWNDLKVPVTDALTVNWRLTSHQSKIPTVNGSFYCPQH